MTRICRRLVWHLVSTIPSALLQLVSERSDLFAFLAQEMNNALQEKVDSLEVFRDLSQASDKVCRKDTSLKLLVMGVSGPMDW